MRGLGYRKVEFRLRQSCGRMLGEENEAREEEKMVGLGVAGSGPGRILGEGQRNLQELNSQLSVVLLR